MESMGNLKRTVMCGDLTENDIGKTVTVMGWTQKYRNLGSLLFVDLRDRSGIIQLSFDDTTDAKLFEKASTIRNEFVLAAVGEVVKRSSVNPDMKTGTIEIKVAELRILNTAQTPPIAIEEDSNVKEEVRLKYRYLDLRRPDMQEKLRVRHRITKIARDYYDENGFWEIETPYLAKSTPEGARDYLVPSRVNPGHFYGLPQSPQLYKQLLMASGMDRYLQIAKCFRDEDLRADRQPEFTQIDLEMSFVDDEDVMQMNEGFVARLFHEIAGVDIPLPLRRMPYREAMDRFGSDKPDTRFGLELNNLSDVVAHCGFKVFTDAISNGGSVRAICVPGGAEKFSRKEIDALGEFVKTYRAKGLAWMKFEENEVKSPIAKFLDEETIQNIKQAVNANTGDLVLFVADKNAVVFDALGALRNHLAKKLDLIAPNTYDILWVTEFPLLEYSEEEERYTAVHHPFTMPFEEDIPLLDTDPGAVRSKTYDIVINGYEAGGGGVRIHDTALQQKMFKELGFTKEDAWERFGFLLEAFKYGAPPHAGMAFGLDRLTMILTNTTNIKDVIAFPKNQNAVELMSDAPSVVDDKQLEELSIDVVKCAPEEN